jgi:hypothetical protein
MEEALGPIERLRTSYQRDPAPFPPGTELLSVDVFDTLLWRRVAKPTDAFLVLGHRLADDGLLSPRCTPERFAQLRWRAGGAARSDPAMEARRNTRGHHLGDLRRVPGRHRREP